MTMTTGIPTSKRMYGATLALLILFTANAAIASLGPAARRADRARDRRDTFEWPSDVRDRLRILDDHAAEAAHQLKPFGEPTTTPSRWRPPSPPVADEEVR